MSPATVTDLARLRALFEGEAMALPYGEDISICVHMLQCAELARARGLAEPLVAAALLHDIGWALPGGEEAHEHLAADLLQPLFGPEVTEPIRLHVAAKRYLITARPGYGDMLSAMSRHTLARQGGAFSPDECLAFKALPYAQAAITLRLLDDAGKEARTPESDFADYLGLLNNLMDGHDL